MIRDVTKIITDARPLYLEIERVLHLCEKFETQTGIKIDESLTYDFQKMSENSLFDENQEKALLRVCLAGKFSSGKSSFLNELLGEDLLPVASIRTTRGITRIHYSTNKLFKKDHQKISFQEYSNAVTEGGNFEISMKVPFLKNLVISDVPGFDPPEKDKEDRLLDEKTSLKEMENADVLIWLCKMSDGGLDCKSEQFLKEYQKEQGSTKKDTPPLYLVITHCQKPESQKKEERDRVAGLIQKQLEIIGVKPEGIFFFSCKKKMEKCSEKHQDFILDEQKRLKETISQMAHKHNSIATQRIKTKVKVLENKFMQSLSEFANHILLYHDKWICEYLEKSKELRNYSFAIGREKKGVIAAFSRYKDVLLDKVGDALEKVKFCYLFTNKGVFFNNFYINKSNDWEEQWANQRTIIKEYIETVPCYFKKYFSLPQNIFHEERIPIKKVGFSTFVFGIKIEESYNDDFTGNSKEKSSLQRRVRNCNKAIQEAWKEKISSQLQANAQAFRNVVDDAFNTKKNAAEKFEVAFTELVKLRHLD